VTSAVENGRTAGRATWQGWIGGVAAAIFAVLACDAAEPGDAPVLRGKVVDVIDGDSVAVQLDSGPIEVRLHAADAPEHDQPGGRAAAGALRKRLPRGAAVVLEPVEQDRYDRLVAVIERDGDSVIAWMVEQGHAWAYRRYTADPRYCRWEDAARQARRGLWSRPPTDWIAPWDWRRRAREPGFQPADHSHETLADCLASLRHERATASLSLSSASLQVASQTTGCAIKGNISKHGERIYHVPGSEWYDATRIDPHKGERWFCSEDEARSAGWRAPR
jgi:endonuclease YncB( thermonuclease family)